MTIQISRLGKYGGWGNQLFQYCAGKVMARRYDTDLCVPSDWIGRTVFQIDDPPITKQLPTRGMDLDPDETPNDSDLWGYFQNTLWFSEYSIEDAQTWLRPRNEWIAAMLALSMDRATVAHVRSFRGYERVYCVVAEEAYEFAAKKFGIGQPIFVSDKHPGNISAVPGLEFLPDFLRLMAASTLMRGNSTFSWWAATLSATKANKKRVFSPVVGDLHGGPHIVPFVENNWSEIVNLKMNAPGEPGRVYGLLRLKGECGEAIYARHQ